MGQITATRNLVATKVVRHAGQWVWNIPVQLYSEKHPGFLAFDVIRQLQIWKFSLFTEVAEEVHMCELPCPSLTTWVFLGGNFHIRGCRMCTKIVEVGDKFPQASDDICRWMTWNIFGPWILPIPWPVYASAGPQDLYEQTLNKWIYNSNSLSCYYYGKYRSGMIQDMNDKNDKRWFN